MQREQMADVGILTFHNNANKGAILQAYCLREALSEHLDVDASVIPYRTASKERSRRVHRYVTKRPRRIPRRVADYRRCESFVESELVDGTDRLVTDDYEAAVAWLNDRDYDVVITGSDEVWKIPDPEDGLRGILFPRRPYPNLYFLGDAIEARTASYGASANRLRLSELSDRERARLRADVSSIDHLSVRDDHTEHLLERLGRPDVSRVPDPTLLVDLPTRPVEGLLREHGIDTSRPVVGVHGDDGPVFERLCERLRARGYQIVSTMGSRHADLRLRGLVDPLEYYSVYDHFDFVVTSSLHSTIFSLQHGTPFVTIDVEDVYRTVQSKTHSLLTEFDYLDRHVDATDGDASAVFERIDELEAPLEEARIADRTATLRDAGLSFLETALADVGPTQYAQRP